MTISRREFAERLRNETLACRLDRSQFGASRKVNEEQKTQMARLFGAEAERLSANKKLLNKRHEAYLAVTGAMNRARECWLDNTIPYPEDGVRLIRRDKVDSFDAAMREIKQTLVNARVELERVYHAELIPEARRTLGALFNPSDYPMEIAGEFDFDWAWVSVDPPEYLREASPKLYQQMQERLAARMEEAIALTEASFVEEFAKVVSHLVDRLTPSPDGKKKVFKDSTLENINEFFQRFRSLNIGSNGDLEALVEQAQRAVAGVEVAALRRDTLVQGQIRTTMAALSERLDAMQVERPNRKYRLMDDEPAAQSSDVGILSRVDAAITSGSVDDANQILQEMLEAHPDAQEEMHGPITVLSPDAA